MTEPTDADTPVADTEVAAAQVAPAAPAAPAAARNTVLLLGAGELSRELALAFQRLGAVVVAVDR